MDRKPILIEGAMRVETETFLAHMADCREYMIGKWPFVSGSYEGIPLVVCQTQWGMANAAACTALAMEWFHPSAVISQGTAGGHDPSLHTFDVVVARRTVNESAWQSEYRGRGEGSDYRAIRKLGVFAYDHEQGRFRQEVYHDCDTELVKAALAAAPLYTWGKVTEGTIGTCDSWNCEADRILFLHEFYGSAAEEMESDAVAQICRTYDVPFLSVRILSNSVFEGDIPWDLSAGPALQEYVLAVVREYAAARCMGDQGA